MLSVVSKAIPEPILIGIRKLLTPAIGCRVAKSWTDAVSKSSGYESNSTIKGILVANQTNNSKIKFVDNRIQQVASAFLEGIVNSGKKIRIIDVGGSLGGYFFALQKLAPSVQFEWVILETPAICKLAKNVTSVNRNISYVSSFDDAVGPFDIALLSGVIQCVEKPFELLEKLMDVTKIFVLNRLPLSRSGADRICIQRPGWFESKGSYPVHIFSEEKLIKYFEARGEILARWLVPQDISVVRFEKIVNQGLTFRPAFGVKIT